MAESSLLDRSGRVVPLPIRNITRSSFFSKPIHSYGFIVKALDTKRWLLVRRLYTVEFQLLMRGSFRTGNLPSLLRCLSAEEREILETCTTDPSVIHQTISLMFPNVDQKIREYATARLQEAAPFIGLLMKNIPGTGTHEWLWPKGQQRPGEDKTRCADREFFEEVGRHMPYPVRNTSFQLQEKIVTTTGRQFESTYWVCLISQEFPVTTPGKQEIEIGERRWATSEEALELLSNTRQKIFLQAKEWADAQTDL